MTTMKTNISRSLILAWAALLVFILGILTWIAIMPAPTVYVGDDIPAAVDLQLPDAMPVDKVILKDKEKTEDSGGTAAVTPLKPQTMLAENHLEKTKFGEIPIIGKDGQGPVTLYAADHVEAPEGAIKVAFVFSSLGRNDALHDKILEGTPAGVTLAYLPESSNLKGKI